jgi:multidrug efflux pump subunit AcrB
LEGTEKNAQTDVSNVEHRAALLSILKTGTSSTLNVINGIKQKLPQMRAAKGSHISAIPNGT